MSATPERDALESPYLSPKQVCEMAPGYTLHSLAQLRYEGRGPKFLKPSPRVVLYRRSDVIEWIESSEQTQTVGRSWDSHEKAKPVDGYAERILRSYGKPAVVSE